MRIFLTVPLKNLVPPEIEIENFSSSTEIDFWKTRNKLLTSILIYNKGTTDISVSFNDDVQSFTIKPGFALELSDVIIWKVKIDGTSISCETIYSSYYKQYISNFIKMA